VESLDLQQRRARRAARIVRFAFYPLVVALAAVLLLGRDHAAGKPVTTKLGATTQGREFKLGLDKKGRPAAFDTALLAICPSGRTIGMPWSPTDGDPVRFERDGDRVRVQESGDGWKLALDGRMTDGGGLRGAVSLVVHVTPKTKPAYDCASPHVRFFAGA
jgi:hypothetical protein